MKCPECATWASVKETRNTPEGKRRRYECANMHRFTTRETVIFSRRWQPQTNERNSSERE
jgi:transcriptional regulator NrdR family protein